MEDNGGAYIVPAFSGLFAPYWRSDARGVVTGLTRYVTKAHLARAVLEATSWQTREVVDAMYQDSGVRITHLKVDGGMTKNNLLMQHQADVLGVPVIRPKVSETTCLGAAYAAGLATGVWNDLDELKAHWQQDVEWTPPGGRRVAGPGVPELAQGGGEQLRLAGGRRGLQPSGAAARTPVGGGTGRSGGAATWWRAPWPPRPPPSRARRRR